MFSMHPQWVPIWCPRLTLDLLVMINISINTWWMSPLILEWHLAWWLVNSWLFFTDMPLSVNQYRYMRQLSTNCRLNVDRVSINILIKDNLVSTKYQLSIEQESIESINRHTTEDTCSTYPYGVRLQNQAYHGLVQCKGFSVPVAHLHSKIYRVAPSEHPRH